MRSKITVTILAVLLVIGAILFVRQPTTPTPPQPQEYTLEPLHVVAHGNKLQAISIAGEVLGEFETRAQLDQYAADNGFEPVAGKPTFYCNALTKKGTLCRRKVKEPGPCWQHKPKP